jgi:exodeoxyribonuclease V alpha subunit
MNAWMHQPLVFTTVGRAEPGIVRTRASQRSKRVGSFRDTIRGPYQGRQSVTVIGHAAIISAGEWITASGEWINDRAHGQRFMARFLKTSAPSSIDGIEKYLGSGMIPGIGPVYAKHSCSAIGWAVTAS